MQNQSPATNHHNNHQDAQHNKHKTQTSTRPQNVNNFLTSNPQLLEEIQNNFLNFDRDQKINKENPINYYYKYDIKTEGKEELNRHLLKFIIDLIYNNETEQKKLKIYLLSQFLINSKFKPYFKIITKSTFNNNLTSINDFYYYIISQGKKKKPFFNIDQININTDQNIIKNCLCCFNEYTEAQTNKKIICNNCRNFELCPPCFDRLENPKKCPLCRSPEIKKIEIEGERLIKYNYNNKCYTETLKYNDISNDELILIYLGYDEKDEGEKIKICIHNFYINDEKFLMNDFINNLDETILYYNTPFLFGLMLDQYNDIIDEETFNFIYEKCQNDSNPRPILKFLGLGGPDGTEENKINFYECILNADGLQHAHNKDFLLKIGRDRGEDLDIYLYSDNSNISEWSINPNYFKNNYNNITNETYIYNMNSLFFLIE